MLRSRSRSSTWMKLSVTALSRQVPGRSCPPPVREPSGRTARSARYRPTDQPPRERVEHRCKYHRAGEVRDVAQARSTAAARRGPSDPTLIHGSSYLQRRTRRAPGNHRQPDTRKRSRCCRTLRESLRPHGGAPSPSGGLSAARRDEAGDGPGGPPRPLTPTRSSTRVLRS